MKNILIVIVGLLVVAGFVAYNRAGDKKPDDQLANVNSSLGQSALQSEEAAFDFGSISMSRGKVTRAFQVKNTGTAELKITKIYTSCMCTEATLKTASGKRGPFGMPGHGIVPKINEAIAPGVEAVVEVVFDPTAHGPAGVGPTERAVYLENTAGEPLVLTIKATVTP